MCCKASLLFPSPAYVSSPRTLPPVPTYLFHGNVDLVAIVHVETKRCILARDSAAVVVEPHGRRIHRLFVAPALNDLLKLCGRLDSEHHRATIRVHTTFSSDVTAFSSSSAMTGGRGERGEAGDPRCGLVASRLRVSSGKQTGKNENERMCGSPGAKSSELESAFSSARGGHGRPVSPSAFASGEVSPCPARLRAREATPRVHAARCVSCPVSFPGPAEVEIFERFPGKSPVPVPNP